MVYRIGSLLNIVKVVKFNEMIVFNLNFEVDGVDTKDMCPEIKC